MLLPGTADAQDAAAPTQERERISFVYFAPDRLGLLIPINDRWFVRGDLGGASFGSERTSYDFTAITSGISLLLRTSRTEDDWGYAAVRFGNVYGDGDGFLEPWNENGLTLSFGGHAQIIDWLGVFGETGVSASYREGESALGHEVDVQGGISMLLGVALRRPRQGAPPSKTPVADVSAGRERPSWVIDGFGSTGVLIPLSTRWLLRPDVGAHASAWRRIARSETSADAGLSLIRRSVPARYGWVYAAARYGLGYDQYSSEDPTWTRRGSLTIGTHVRLSERVGVFGEAGPYWQQEQQRYVDGLFRNSTAGFIHSVGLSYQWRARRP